MKNKRLITVLLTAVFCMLNIGGLFLNADKLASANDITTTMTDVTDTMEIVDSGTCGENLTWTLDSEGTMIISGEGEMPFWSWQADYGVKKVIIEQGVVNIGSGAFSGKLNLLSVEIPDSVVSIDDMAFCGCSNLSSINIPDSVGHIGSGAFSGCNLNAVTLPEGLAFIGQQAFDCPNLTRLCIQNPYCYIEDDPLIIYSNTATIVGYYGSSAYTFAKEHNLNFEAIIDGKYSDYIGLGAVRETRGEKAGYAVWKIDKEGSLTITGEGGVVHGSWDDFAADIRRVIIEPGITYIGSSMFSGCTGMTNITLPEGIISIGESAFSGCTGLTSVTLPESVTDIGASAFSGCTGLTSMTLSEGITTIPGSLFSKCTGLKEIIIPNSVKYIALKAFEYCSGLKEVTILNPKCNINSIPGTVLIHGYADSTAEKYADDNGNSFEPLENCGDNLTWTLDDEGTLTISGTGKMFDLNVNYTPWNNKDVRSVIIESGVTSIGSAAFGGCSNLTSISIPTSVDSIGRSAFGYCDSLSSIIIPAGVKEIGEYAFSGCSSLKSVSISESVESIGEGAFSSCFSLTTIELPDSITSIERSVFSSCHNLASITIPESVTNLSLYAFRDCENLKDVTVLNPFCMIEHDEGYGGLNGVVLHGYPGSTIEIYADDFGLPFRSIAEEALKGDVNDDAKVNAKDAQYVLIAYTESLTTGIVNLNEKETEAADVDGNGKVSVADAQYILLYYVQNEVAGTPTTWEDLIA